MRAAEGVEAGKNTSDNAAAPTPACKVVTQMYADVICRLVCHAAVHHGRANEHSVCSTALAARDAPNRKNSDEPDTEQRRTVA